MIRPQTPHAQTNRRLQSLQGRLRIALGHDIMQDTNAIHRRRHFKGFRTKFGAGKIEGRHVGFQRIVVIPPNVLNLANAKENRQCQGLITAGPLFERAEAALVESEGLFVLGLVVMAAGEIVENRTVNATVDIVAQFERIAKVVHAFIVLGAVFEWRFGRVGGFHRRGSRHESQGRQFLAYFGPFEIGFVASGGLYSFLFGNAEGPAE